MRPLFSGFANDHPRKPQSDVTGKEATAPSSEIAHNTQETSYDAALVDSKTASTTTATNVVVTNNKSDNDPIMNVLAKYVDENVQQVISRYDDLVQSIVSKSQQQELSPTLESKEQLSLRERWQREIHNLKYRHDELDYYDNAASRRPDNNAISEQRLHETMSGWNSSNVTSFPLQDESSEFSVSNTIHPPSRSLTDDVKPSFVSHTVTKNPVKDSNIQDTQHGPLSDSTLDYSCLDAVVPAVKSSTTTTTTAPCGNDAGDFTVKPAPASHLSAIEDLQIKNEPLKKDLRTALPPFRSSLNDEKMPLLGTVGLNNTPNESFVKQSQGADTSSPFDVSLPLDNVRWSAQDGKSDEDKLNPMWSNLSVEGDADTTKRNATDFNPNHSNLLRDESFVDISAEWEDAILSDAVFPRGDNGLTWIEGINNYDQDDSVGWKDKAMALLSVMSAEGWSLYDDHTLAEHGYQLHDGDQELHEDLLTKSSAFNVALPITGEVGPEKPQPFSTVESLLNEADEGATRLSTEQYNVILLSIATSASPFNHTMVDNILKTYYQMKATATCDEGDSFPNAETYSILLTVLDGRGRCGQGALEICSHIVEESEVWTRGLISHVMQCYEHNNEPTAGRNFLQLVIENKRVPPCDAFLSLVRLLKRAHLVDEGVELLDTCIKVRGLRCWHTHCYKSSYNYFAFLRFMVTTTVVELMT